jgi:hypothetical protein
MGARALCIASSLVRPLNSDSRAARRKLLPEAVRASDGSDEAALMYRHRRTRPFAGFWRRIAPCARMFPSNRDCPGGQSPTPWRSLSAAAG